MAHDAVDPDAATPDAVTPDVAAVRDGDRESPYGAALDPTFGPPEVAETHSAWVVFLGDRAYKIKKPIRLDFLDFSTRAAREQITHQEVALNQRLAPDVYLGVADVLGPDGRPCDHVVVMRRLPQDARLRTLVERGEPVGTELRDVARRIAVFHATAVTSPEIAAAGAPGAVRDKLERDIAELRVWGADVLDLDVLDDVARMARRFLDGRNELFEARAADGFVRDGHGDLLTDDIFCLPDGPRILDCIEFDAHLRHGDVLADVAFLAMDLEHVGDPSLATQLLAWYAEFSGEHHPETLAHYYVASRALIRAKVDCLRSTQGDPDGSGSAQRHLDLAHDHLRRAQVTLVLVGGAPGTGKSTLAATLADRSGWSLLASDEVRKDVTGVGRSSAHRARFGAGIYTTEATRATYEALLARAERALRFGEPVIIDASWSKASWRADAARLAAGTSSESVELCCDAPPGVAAARIVARQESGSAVSDADPRVAAEVRAGFDPWPGAHRLSTLRSPDSVAATALELIDRHVRRG